MVLTKDISRPYEQTEDHICIISWEPIPKQKHRKTIIYAKNLIHYIILSSYWSHFFTNGEAKTCLLHLRSLLSCIRHISALNKEVATNFIGHSEVCNSKACLSTMFCAICKVTSLVEQLWHAKTRVWWNLTTVTWSLSSYSLRNGSWNIWLV